MPIPREKLEETRRPLAERIVAFLGRDPTQAFDVWEICMGVEGFTDTAASAVMRLSLSKPDKERLLAPYYGALTQLVAQEVVESALYQKRNYYAIKAPK